MNYNIKLLRSIRICAVGKYLSVMSQKYKMQPFCELVIAARRYTMRYTNYTMLSIFTKMTFKRLKLSMAFEKNIVYTLQCCLHTPLYNFAIFIVMSGSIVQSQRKMKLVN